MKGKLLDLITGIAGVAGVEGVDQGAEFIVKQADQASRAAQVGDWTAIVGQVLIALATFWKLIFGSPEQVKARKEARKERKARREL